MAGTVSNSGFVPVSGNEDHRYLLRQDGACNFALSLRRMHRQARYVSARLCALPRSRFCSALLLPYAADGFTLDKAPVPCLQPGLEAYASLPPSLLWPPCNSVALRPHPALACAHRTAVSATTTGNLSPLSRLTVSGPFSIWNSRPASRRKWPCGSSLSDRLRIPDDVSLISTFQLRSLKLRLERFSFGIPTSFPT